MSDIIGQFSSDDVERLQTEWKLIRQKDLADVGVKLLLLIFEYEPMVQRSFPALRNASPTDLEDNDAFRTHARRFMHVVGDVVFKLGAGRPALPQLNQIGEKHKKVEGYKVDYLKSFAVAMEEVWLEELGNEVFDEKSKNIWRKIFDVIIDGVEDGYNAQE